MAARTIVITGASDGIGAHAARLLAGQGDRVIVVGRSPEKTRAAAEGIGAEHLLADFAHLDQVHRLAEEIRTRTGSIDVLANNAGGMIGAPGLTEDRIETTLQVNHVAPFLLTQLLMEPLLADGGGAVVNTSSQAHRFGRIDPATVGAEPVSPGRAYGQAKLANILHARGLHARFHEQGLSAVAFHPGVVATGFGSSAHGFFHWFYGFGPVRRLMTSAEDGGAHLAWFADGTPGTTWHSGVYYEQRRLAKPSRAALDDALVDGLWQRTEQLAGLD